MDSKRMQIGKWYVTTYYDPDGAPLRENGYHAERDLSFSGSPTAGYLVTADREGDNAETVGKFATLDSLLESG